MAPVLLLHHGVTSHDLRRVVRKNWLTSASCCAWCWRLFTVCVMTQRSTSFGRVHLPNMHEMSWRIMTKSRRASVGPCTFVFLTSFLVSASRQEWLGPIFFQKMQ